MKSVGLIRYTAAGMEPTDILAIPTPAVVHGRGIECRIRCLTSPSENAHPDFSCPLRTSKFYMSESAGKVLNR
jgi:hypothetical protein